MIRVLVVDDELLARQRLERLLGAVPDVEVVAACASAEEAAGVLREEAVDLALLDIDMPGLSGLDAAALMAREGLAVVFVTAHPEFALAAFGVGARDYLLKPVDAERLGRAVDRARRPSPAISSDPLAIPGARGVRLVAPAELSHAVIEGESVALHVGEQVLYTDWTLNELERRLPPARFVRVHRRALVALDAVVLLEPNDEGGYLARLRSGATVVVSRAAARALRRRLGI